MELFTVDEKREISLPIYFEKDEKNLCGNPQMFKFILVSEGTGILELNQKKFVLMAPTIFCLNEMDVLHIDDPKNIKTKSIHFLPSLVNDVFSIENIRDDALQLTDSQNRDYYLFQPFIIRSNDNIGQLNIDMITAQRISEFMNYLDTELASLSNNFWRCRSRSYFLQILFFLQHICTEKEVSNKFEILNDSDISNKILLYLHANYEKKISLQQLTEVFHINRTTLAGEFQKTTNLSIFEYLIRLRVHMASIMIKNTDLPINEIMYRTGFNDITHFGRMFRKRTGCSPSEYRLTNI